MKIILNKEYLTNLKYFVKPLVIQYVFLSVLTMNVPFDNMMDSIPDLIIDEICDLL